MNTCIFPRSAVASRVESLPVYSFTRRFSVNKSELVEALADRTDSTKADAERALSSLIEIIEGALKKGDDVALVGFGTFKVMNRSARTGKNPRTGEALKIPARKVPKFSPGKSLKDLVGGAKK